MKKTLKGPMSADDFRRGVEPDPEVRELRARVTSLTRQIDEIREGEGKIEAALNEMTEAIALAPPPPRVYQPPKGKAIVEHPCSAVLHLTDWHYGAVQGAAEIEGFGEFSPEIARARLLDELAPSFIDWVTLHRKSYRIDECVVPVTGDLVSGDIHEELRVTNAFPSPVQAVGAGFLLRDLLTLISPHFARVRVECITADNHSRLTRKPQAKEAGLNSFSYCLAFLAKEATRNLANVEFNIYPQLSKSIEIAGMRYLIMHGHTVLGWLGFPYYGVERYIGREALKRMNAPAEMRFHKALIGHWHAPLRHAKYLIGGSLSGTDAYDHGAGRESAPTQTAWLIHPKRGEFDWIEFKL